MLESKKCFKCGSTLPLSEFYKHIRMASGYLGKCKVCTKRDVKENYKSNIEYYKQYEKSRAMSPHRIEARAAYQATETGKVNTLKAKRNYLKRNPLKRKTHIAVGNAIRDGRLTRQPCEICNKQKAHAHHDDYSKPLDVRWLCTKHHAEWHKNNTPLCPEQTQAA
jgi:hypothetical protein